MIEFLAKYPYILWILEIGYLVGILFLAVKIILDTQNVSKTLGYLMVIFFLPVIGVMIYFLFGINFQKNKFYNIKIKQNKIIYKKIKKLANTTHQITLKDLPDFCLNSINTINFLYNSSHSILTKTIE